MINIEYFVLGFILGFIIHMIIHDIFDSIENKFNHVGDRLTVKDLIFMLEILTTKNEAEKDENNND